MRYIITIILLVINPLFGYSIDFDGRKELIGKGAAYSITKENTADPAAVWRQGAFHPIDKTTPNFKLSDDTYWIKFSINNISNSDLIYFELDNPFVSDCRLYDMSEAASPLLLGTASADSVFSNRRNNFTTFIFKFSQEKNTRKDYLLKVKSSEQLFLPMILYGQEPFMEARNTRNLVVGMFCGMLLVMILYNLFLLISVKDPSYLYYILYILFIGLAQLTLLGYSFKYFFPNHPGFFNISIVFFSGLAGLAGVAFTAKFLHTRVKSPLIHKWLLGIAGTYAITMAIRLAGFHAVSSRLLDVAGLMAVAAGLAAAIRLSRQGYRPATYFLIAWSIFLIGLLLFVMRNLNLLPYTPATNYTMQAGIALEVALLSIALGDRINTLEAERKKARELALAQAKENERLIQEQNVVLERNVAARTAELAQAFDNLKQTQAQLVEQEKMASLGQLTAGIAHEINNPINFVTSNVKPLQRDIAQVLGGFEQMTALAISGEAVNQPEKIEAIKEEIEFDYLKEEISFLLKGIREGSERTAEIVKGLRIFSRIDESDLKRTNVLDGLDSTAIIVNTLLNNRIALKKEYSSLPMIECYPGKLNQVFLNIISNGIYAVNERWGERPGGQITIGATADDQQVRISIADNGMGMDEPTKAKLFEPFFTTKEVGEGTGLGLSIAYNIIRKHNGHIQVQSKLGEGTEFVIVLPILQPTIPPDN